MNSIAVSLSVGLLVVPLLVVLTRRYPIISVGIVIGLVCFSAHVLALLYSAGAPAWMVRGLIPVKDWIALTVAVTLALSRREPARRLLWLLSAVIVPVVFGCVIALLRPHHVPLEALISSARDLMVAPIGMTIAFLLTTGERDRVRRIGAVVVGFAAAWGLIEYVAPWSLVTHIVAVGRYWADVKGQPQFLVNIPGAGLLPGNFTTNPYVIGATRRLVGPFGDPLTAGVLCAVGLVWSLTSFRNARVWVVPALASGTALLLSFTRAGWLLAAAAIIPMVIARAHRAFQGDTRKVALVLGVGLAALTTVVLALPFTRTYLIAMATGRSSSTNGHLAALRQLGSQNYSVVGGGVGTAGAIVDLGTESAAATVLLQLGLVGGAIYLGSCLALLGKGKSRWDPGVAQLLVVLVLVFSSWFSSEQWLTFNSGLPTAMFAVLGGSLTDTPISVKRLLGAVGGLGGVGAAAQSSRARRLLR